MIKAHFSNKIFAATISFLFVALFGYAALSKLADYQKFSVQIAQSPLLEPMAGFIAWFIPTIEIVVSIFLLFNKTRLAALYAAFSLMAIFTTYLIAITQFSDYIPCSCGGVLENLSWSSHLWFNAAFILLAAAAVYVYPVNADTNKMPAGT